MVSFKGAFVVCLFYIYSYGVVQAIFYFLLVLPWWLWCRSSFLFDLLVFCRCFIFCLFFLDGYGVVQGSFVVCLFYLYSYGVVDLLFFACFTLMVMVSFNGVVQGIFYFLLVLPWWLWCRSRELLLFVCFIFIVMVSFKGSFIFCLFYLDGYGVVQGIFIVMVSFKGSFIFCLFYLDGYGVVQGSFCCLFVLSL